VERHEPLVEVAAEEELLGAAASKVDLLVGRRTFRGFDASAPRPALTSAIARFVRMARRSSALAVAAAEVSTASATRYMRAARSNANASLALAAAARA
jgi:hypothetical protein